jgi:hypothetical protein
MSAGAVPAMRSRAPSPPLRDRPSELGGRLSPAHDDLPISRPRSGDDGDARRLRLGVRGTAPSPAATAAASPAAATVVATPSPPAPAGESPSPHRNATGEPGILARCADSARRLGRAATRLRRVARRRRRPVRATRPSGAPLASAGRVVEGGRRSIERDLVLRGRSFVRLVVRKRLGPRARRWIEQPIDLTQLSDAPL